MRDIKFRGFAVEEMVKSQWLTGFGVMPIEMSDDYAKRTGVKKEVYLYTENGTYQVKELSIGQYTGLKDKNGVEIYEGDYVLVEVDDAFYYGDFAGVVRFIDGSWVVDKPNEELINLFSETNEIDILGNIYENPELLEVNKNV